MGAVERFLRMTNNQFFTQLIKKQLFLETNTVIMFNIIKKITTLKNEEKRLKVKLCISWQFFFNNFLIWCQGNICINIPSLDTSQTTYSGNQQKKYKIIEHTITYKNKNLLGILKLFM